MPSPLTLRLSDLATIISTNTKILEDHITSEKLPYPSFSPNGPATFPESTKSGFEHIQAAREALQQASKDMLDLTTGPTEGLGLEIWNFNITTTIRAIVEFKIAEVVPLDGEATFAEIAEKTNTNEKRVRQVIRMAMTARVFYEPRPGYVAHTRASRVLAEDKNMQTWVEFNGKEVEPASGSLVQAMREHPHSGDPGTAAYAVANGNQSLYSVFGADPKRAQLFGKAMMAFDRPGHSHDFLVKNSVWSRLGSHPTVVDVGGNVGHVAIALAKAYPDMKLIVQDLPHTVQQGETLLPEELKSQISFQTHNFLEEQPVKDADAFLFRWIFHNWSDDYSIKILQSLVPSLKDGAKIIINDGCLPDPNTSSLWDETRVRSMDMCMLLTCNALERELDDWRSLIERADRRFRFDSAIRPEGALMFIIEATFIADRT